MRQALLAIAFAGTLLASAAGAQTVTPGPVLELGPPITVDGKPIPVDPNATTLLAPWTYRFASPPAAAATFGGGNVTLTWSLACVQTGVRLTAAAVTSVAFVANEVEYTGVAMLPVGASPQTPGDVPLACILGAKASAATTAMETNATIAFEPQAAFRGEIRLEAPVKTKMAGPQKQIHYAVDIENRGNSLTEVRFDLVDRMGGKWQVILPERLLLEPGARGTAILSVATPFHTGYVSDSSDVVLRATPASAKNSDQVGPSQDVEFNATARGWYVPGPSPMLALGALALAALAVRRRS